MTKEIMSKICGITMEEYNKHRIGKTMFLESWEYSVKPTTKRVVVMFCPDVFKKRSLDENVVRLEGCRLEGENGLFLADMLSYDKEHNSARLRIISDDPEIDTYEAVGSPLCSESYFKRFWKKKLKRFGSFEEVMMRK